MKWYAILLFVFVVVLFILTPQPLISQSIYNNGQDGSPYMDGPGIPFIISQVSYYWLPYLAVAFISVLMYFYNNLYTSIGTLILSIGILVMFQYTQFNYMNATPNAYDFNFLPIHRVVRILLQVMILASLVNLILEAVRLGRKSAKLRAQQINDRDLLDSI